MNYKTTILCVLAATAGFLIPISYEKTGKTTAPTQGKQIANSHIELQELAKADHIKILSNALKSYNKRAYKCTFIKQERINGNLGKEQEIEVSFKEQPFSLKMVWTKNIPFANKIVYVSNKNLNKNGTPQMLIFPESKFIAAFVGNCIKKLPNDSDVMKNTLNPCTKFGFRNTLQNLIDVYSIAKTRGDCQIESGGIANIDGKECIVLIRYLTYSTEYPAMKTIIYLSIEDGLPLEIYGYDWNKQLVCHYAYKNIQFLDDIDDKEFE
jgi:hypothetical protein